MACLYCNCSMELLHRTAALLAQQLCSQRPRHSCSQVIHRHGKKTDVCRAVFCSLMLCCNTTRVLGPEVLLLLITTSYCATIMCRTRFVPPGAREGTNTKGRVDSGELGGCGRFSNKDSAACKYNVDVKLGSTQYTPQSCASNWLYNATYTNATRDLICYPGSSFLYTHANDCQDMPSDMRLSNSVPGGSDKCDLVVGGGGTGGTFVPGAKNGTFVAADDFWAAVVSYEHDPCGWPFMECVADCSLPSDISTKGWTVSAVNQSVMDPNLGLPVGCTDPGSPCSTQKVMKDPKVANLIGAM